VGTREAWVAARGVVKKDRQKHAAKTKGVDNAHLLEEGKGSGCFLSGLVFAGGVPRTRGEKRKKNGNRGRRLKTNGLESLMSGNKTSKSPRTWWGGGVVGGYAGHISRKEGFTPKGLLSPT